MNKLIFTLLLLLPILSFSQESKSQRDAKLKAKENKVNSKPSTPKPQVVIKEKIVEVAKENDQDGDGIVDNKDKCPNEYGELKNEGCPKKVEDNTSIIIDTIKEIKAKLFNGFAEYQYDNGLYKGYIKQGIPNGEGIYIYNNFNCKTKKYINGKFTNGLPYGICFIQVFNEDCTRLISGNVKFDSNGIIEDGIYILNQYYKVSIFGETYKKIEMTFLNGQYTSIKDSKEEGGFLNSIMKSADTLK